MDEKKAKELTDSIFNKLNDQERVYLAWIHNQKNKEIQELKKENEFLKLSNPEMNLEHFRYVKENKRKIDNLRLINKRLSNNWDELIKWLEDRYYGRDKYHMDSDVIGIKDVIKRMEEIAKGSAKE